MKHYGFSLSAFLTWWLLVYFVVRQVAMSGQLYIFSSVDLCKTTALFGAVSIVLSNVLGVLLLSESMSIGAYQGIALTVLAFVVLAFS